MAQTSVYEKAMRFLKMLKGKTKRLGQRKLILAALFTVQIDNYALTFHRDSQADSRRPEDTRSKKMSAVNSKLLTVLQEVNLHQVAERFPDEVCCPLHIRHV